jgi:fatty acid desaturase
MALPPGDLAKRPDWVSASCIIAHAAVVFGPLFAAVTQPPGLWWVLCYLWFGTTVHGLLNLLHEAAHYHVFSSRAACDVLGRWVLGPLVFADFDAYRRRHWDHHRYFGSADDTKDAYLSPVRGRGLPALLWRCLTLKVAVRKWRLQTPGDADHLDRPAMLRTALVQAVFFAALLATAAVAGELSWTGALARTLVFYAVVFAYGLASLSPFVASLRTIAEHQPGSDGAPRYGRAVLRNFRCGLLERFVFGAYGFAEHATHHLHPAVPSYRLAALSRRSEGDLRPPRGYLSTLAMLARNGAAGRAGAVMHDLPSVSASDTRPGQG